MRRSGRQLSSLRVAALLVAWLFVGTACGDTAPTTAAPSVSPGVQPASSSIPLLPRGTGPPPEPPPTLAIPPPTEDPNATLPPFPTSHADPELEALIGLEISGIALQTASFAGEEAAMAGGYLPVLLSALGKSTGDLSTAIAADADARVPGLIFALRVRGSRSDELIGAFLRVTSYEDAPAELMAAKQIRRIDTAASPVYVYVSGDVLFVVQSTDVAVAEDILTQLP